MNWYKRAKWNWKDFSKGVGKGMGLGLGAGLPLLRPTPVSNDFSEPAPIVSQDLPSQSPQPPQQVLNPSPQLPAQSQQNRSIDIRQSLKQQFIVDEDKRNLVYPDNRGIPTIGIGFNLNRADARKKISELGLNYEAVLQGQQSLNEQQIDLLLSGDIDTAIRDAQTYLPSFNSQPPEVQLIVSNMAFNLGLTRLSQFVKLKSALEAKDYGKAAIEMQNSAWYGQTKNRAKRLVEQMKNVK